LAVVLLSLNINIIKKYFIVTGFNFFKTGIAFIYKDFILPK